MNPTAQHAATSALRYIISLHSLPASFLYILAGADPPTQSSVLSREKSLLLLSSSFSPCYSPPPPSPNPYLPPPNINPNTHHPLTLPSHPSERHIPPPHHQSPDPHESATQLRLSRCWVSNTRGWKPSRVSTWNGRAVYLRVARLLVWSVVSRPPPPPPLRVCTYLVIVET